MKKVDEKLEKKTNQYLFLISSDIFLVLFPFSCGPKSQMMK